MKILYILDSFNIFGGTPKKTLDLMSYFKSTSFLYVYSNEFEKFSSKFEQTGGKVFACLNAQNIFSQLKNVLKIIDDNNIKIIQAQFNFGSILAGLIKILRPKIKLIIAFVGPFKSKQIFKLPLSFVYIVADHIVYVSEYVKKEKIKEFNLLQKKNSTVIYNGTNNLDVKSVNSQPIKHVSLFDVAGLVDWKNIQIVIKALSEICSKKHKFNLYFYVSGEGPYRNELEKLIAKLSLEENVKLMGYTSNVGAILKEIDIFVHPAYAEGFGIAVVEAMLAEKPIIVSNAGALPELIENNVSGLVVDPHDSQEWAAAILKLIENKEFAKELATNARKRAKEKFSIERFCKNYEKLYLSLLM